MVPRFPWTIIFLLPPPTNSHPSPEKWPVWTLSSKQAHDADNQWHPDPLQIPSLQNMFRGYPVFFHWNPCGIYSSEGCVGGTLYMQRPLSYGHRSVQTPLPSPSENEKGGRDHLFCQVKWPHPSSLEPQTGMCTVLAWKPLGAQNLLFLDLSLKIVVFLTSVSQHEPMFLHIVKTTDE